MISEWKVELEKLGFVYRKFSPSERALVKEIGVIEHQIWEDSFIRNGERQIVINTAVSVQDPFAGKSKFVTVVSGRLDSSGIIRPRSEGNVGRYWNPKDSSEALGVLLERGMAWFSGYSDLPALKKFVESDLLTLPHPKTSILEVLGIIRRDLKNNITKIKPINRLKLCLIEYHMGNSEAACEHAMEWLKHTSKMPGEPARTYRQLREMGCKEFGSGVQ